MLCTVIVAAMAMTAVAQPAAPLAPAEKASDVRVGIVVELTVNVSPERAEQLAAALADALHRELEVDAVGGGDVSRRLPEGGVPEECLASKDCISDLARRLDCNQLLFLAVVQVGADIQIDSSWVDIASGEVTSRPRIDLLADARAGEVFSAAATRLLPHARKRPLAVVVTPGEPRPTGPEHHLTTGVWIAAGAGTVALVGGVVFGLKARSGFQRCQTDAANCELTQEERDRIDRNALFADLLLGGAVAGLATATILYLRSDRRETARETPTKPGGAATAWSLTPTRGGAFAELRVGF